MPALQAKSLIASHSLMSQEILTFQRNKEQRKILKLNSIILANQIVMLHIWVLPWLSLWETVTVQIYNFTMNLNNDSNWNKYTDLWQPLFNTFYINISYYPTAPSKVKMMCESSTNILQYCTVSYFLWLKKKTCLTSWLSALHFPISSPFSLFKKCMWNKAFGY